MRQFVNVVFISLLGMLVKMTGWKGWAIFTAALILAVYFFRVLMAETGCEKEEEEEGEGEINDL